jgi:NAD(P)-dependent dehydrogenase (short-subunit alcohol dehydrogenase family)
MTRELIIYNKIITFWIIGEQIRDAGGSAIFVQTDVTRAGDCARAAAATVEAFGKLDIAVNNAGTETYGKSLVETDEAAWDSVLGVNLKGAFCR